MAISEIILPDCFLETAFSATAEQVPSITINLPNKMFAVPEYGIDVSATRAGQLYTHWQLGIDDGAPVSKKWDLVRWYQGDSVNTVVSRIPANADFAVISQIMEDRGHAGMIFDTAFMDACFVEIFSRTGQADPANTNIIGDYFDGDGLSQSALQAIQSPSGSTFWNTWRSRFSSETEARKNRDGVTSSYFTRNGSNPPSSNRNWMVSGYHDGWHRIPEYSHIYHLIAEIEQKHLAIRRKVFQFSWDVLEGSEWKIYRMGSYQGIKFTNPAGTIYKSTLNYVPPEINFRQGVIDSLLGDGVMYWGPAGRSTHDISRWVRSYNGGFDVSKTKWLKDGSNSPVDYNPNDPTMPAKSPGDNPNNYTGNNVQIIPPTFAGPGPNGIHHALGGRYAAAQAPSVANLRWPSFSYKLNGGSSLTGYASSNNPVTGSLGNATLSTLNNRNFGQHNIINQYEAKKPICWVAGSPGNGLIVWCNPQAKLTEVNEVTISESGSHVFEATGPSMRLFTW